MTWRRICLALAVLIGIDLVACAGGVVVGGYELLSLQHSVHGARLEQLLTQARPLSHRLSVSSVAFGVARVAWAPWQPLMGTLAQNRVLRTVGTVGPLLDLAADGSIAGAQALDSILPASGQAQHTSESGAAMSAVLATGLQRDAVNRAVRDVAAVRRDWTHVDVRALPRFLRQRLSPVPQGLALADEALRFALVAPDLLGGVRARDYLLVPQNPWDLRPTGGFIGTAALLHVHSGNVSLAHYQDSVLVDTGRSGYVPPPLPLLMYQHFSNWYYRDANWSPDFPTSAALLRYFYWLGQGLRPDGVVAFDSHLLPALLAVTGPVPVRGTGVVLTSHNAIAQLDHYVNGIGPENKAFAGAAYRDVFTRMRTLGGASLPRLLQALRIALTQRHLLLWTPDERLETMLAEHGWDGAINQTRSDYLYVVDANVHYNKINQLVHEKVSYHTTIRQDRSLQSTLTIDYVNAATLHNIPPPQNNTLYEDFVRVYVPLGSRLLASSGLVERWAVTRAHNKTVLAGYLRVPSRGHARVTFTYIVPSNALGASQQYDLVVQKQAGTEDLPFAARIEAPAPSVHVRGASAWSWTGVERTDLHLSVPVSGGYAKPVPLAYDASRTVTIAPNRAIEPWMVIPAIELSPGSDCSNCTVSPSANISASPEVGGRHGEQQLAFHGGALELGPGERYVAHLTLPAVAPRMLRLIVRDEADRTLNVLLAGALVAKVRPLGEHGLWAPVEIPLPSTVRTKVALELQNPSTITDAAVRSVTLTYIPSRSIFSERTRSGATGQIAPGQRVNTTLWLPGASTRDLRIDYMGPRSSQLVVQVNEGALGQVRGRGAPATAEFTVPSTAGNVVTVGVLNTGSTPIGLTAITLHRVPSTVSLGPTGSYTGVNPGQQVTAQLALLPTAPRVLRVVYLNLPGRDLEVRADGTLLATLHPPLPGPTWATAEIPLPATIPATFRLALRNPGVAISAVSAASVGYIPAHATFYQTPPSPSAPGFTQVNTEQQVTAQLALLPTAPRVLRVVYLNLPGRDLEVRADGTLLATLHPPLPGPTWATAEIPLPATIPATFRLALRNPGVAISAVSAASVGYIPAHATFYQTPPSPSAPGYTRVSPASPLVARLALNASAPRVLHLTYLDLRNRDMDILIDGTSVTQIRGGTIGGWTTRDIPLPNWVATAFDVKVLDTGSQLDPVSEISVGYVPHRVVFSQTTGSGSTPNFTVVGPGATLSARLALPSTRPRVLHIVYLDLPGRDIEVRINRRLIARIKAGLTGGTWVHRQFPLPADIGPAFEVELRNPGKAQDSAVSEIAVTYAV